MGRFRWGVRLSVAAFLVGLCFAAWWSLRIGWADYQVQSETVSGTGSALRWIPDSSAYWERLSLLETDVDQVQSLRALETAARLNPLDSNLWVELAMRAEASGDIGTAERRFLKAAELDRGFTPRWSLANFYVRQNRQSEFWRWFRESLQTIPSDPTPLFNLVRRFDNDEDRVALLIESAKPDVQSAYLSYLSNALRGSQSERGRNDLLEAVALSLSAWHRAADVPALLTVCDEFLGGGDSDRAMRVWNALADNRAIPFPALHPERGASVVNPELGIFPVSHGFDWSLPATTGARAALQKDPSGIRLSFSGDEPESSSLLTQTLLVNENARYHLDFLFRTTGIDAPSGLSWQAFDPARGNRLSGSQDLAASSETEGVLDFATPSGCRLVAIALTYRRALGATRLQGAIVLRQFHLSRIDNK